MLEKPESESERDLSGPDSPHFVLPEINTEANSDAKADGNGWEEVADGRFMPTRTRGSCHGRALG